MLLIARLTPPEFAIIFIILAGLAFILQARKFGVRLILAGIACALLPPLVAPFLPFVPPWLMALLCAGTALSVSQLLLNLTIGRGAADQVVGTLVADLIRFVVLLPFRLFGAVLGLVFRRTRP